MLPEGICYVKIDGIMYQKNPACIPTGEEITYTDMHPPDAKIKEGTEVEQKEDAKVETA